MYWPWRVESNDGSLEGVVETGSPSGSKLAILTERGESDKWNMMNGRCSEIITLERSVPTALYNN